MNDGYIAQDDRGGRQEERERERERVQRGLHMQYMLRGCVSEIYFHCETGEVRGNSGIIKLCT